MQIFSNLRLKILAGIAALMRFNTLFVIFIVIQIKSSICTNETTTLSSFDSMKSKLSNKVADKYNKFREFLKWDVECNFLNKLEREIRVSQGRCPPLTTTTAAPVVENKGIFSFFKRDKKKKKRKRSSSLFGRGSKRKVLSLITMGQQSIDSIKIDGTRETYNFLAGTLLEVSCGEIYKNETFEIVWFVNTNKIEIGLLDWRVTIDDQSRLSIWPLTVEDSGIYECTKNGVLVASAQVFVKTLKDAFLDGLFNYFFVSFCFLPVSVISIVILNRKVLDPPESSLKEDRMVLFLEDHIKKAWTKFMIQDRFNK
ncbi:unnamed protein product [Auanema sp. JU1783]|nr:unnamed protein product [Auanema sp. JU1783]